MSNSSFIDQNTITVSLLDDSKNTGVKYGLNWGFEPETNKLRIEKGKSESSRTGNESYLQLPKDVYETDFFPETGNFVIIDDNGYDFTFSRSQSKEKGGKPQALSISESNRIFGLYLRHRLGLKSGQLITKNDLLNYGKTEITFKKDNGIYYMDFSSNQKSIKDTKIPYPHNRIIFGAPGTGKSYRLENQRKKFFDEGIVPTQEQIIASEIQEAGNNHGSCFAIGLKYSEFFSGKKPKNLKAEYNCSNEDAYTICQGMRAKDFYASLPDYKTEELSEQKIKYQLEKLKNEKYMNQAGCAAIGLKYSDFLQDNSISDISNMFDLSRTSSLATWIYYGMQAADYTFDETSAQKSLKHYERVTFHPNYSYSQFVGCYKPKMKSVQTDEGEKEEITYSFVPGPFLRVYVNAIKNPGENFLLLIEEINRANVAAVFGDVFQLLDRKDGKSEYPVAAGEDIRKYLKTEGINQSELSIPKNMFIWATMNSADQGVFPMDTAFKRRWNFEYIGIDENESGVSASEIPISRIVNEKKIIKKVKWNDLRHAINTKLISLNVNEDKLLGPYFIGEKDLEDAMQKQEDFIKLFKSKVLMYLFEDAAKMKRNFFNCDKYIYSEICKEFDEKGIEVFNFSDDEKGKLKELDIAPNPENPEPASE